MTELHNVFLNELNEHALIIEGETQDVANGRCYTYDKIPIKHLELMIVEFYMPKV